MIVLNKSVTLTVPKIKNDGSDMSLEVFKRMDDITKFFGGVTVTEAVGHWFNDVGDKYIDDNLIYEWNVGHVDDTDEAMSRIMLGILGLINAGDQEAVFFKLGSTAYIYDNSTSNIISDHAEHEIVKYLGGF